MGKAQSGRSASAARQARLRDRLRRGVIPVTIEVDAQVIETLINIGWLSDQDSHDRKCVARALATALQLWARGIA